MFRQCVALAASFAILAGLSASAEEVVPLAPRPLASALHAADRDDWVTALALASRDGAVARDIVEWRRLRSGAGSLAEILDFLARRGDWPGLDYLRAQGERALEGANDADILSFFADHPPQTGTGVLLHAAALIRAGERGEAEAELVLAWHSLELSLSEHEAFLAAHEPLLRPHHAARLAMCVWRRLRDDAERMQPLVNAEDWRLAEARVALQRGETGVDERLEKLSPAQQSDAGLAYDRFVWRLRARRHDEARELMLERSAIPGGLGYAENWANQRRIYAREDMRDGLAERAYRLASTHQLHEGSNYADLEWLSGYIALRKLNQPEIALRHFQNFLAAVATPISLGRGYYWIGRAQQAAGNPAAAQAAYLDGAKQQTTFYGLLAAEAAGVGFDPELAGTERFGDWRQSALAKSPLREAGVLLLAAGQRNLAERFLMQLANQLDRDGLGQLGRMLEARGETHLEVMLGKTAAQRAIVMPRHYYPLHPMREMDLPVPMELALAIARRESEFDPRVTSHVGAGGLMQLMPGTAREVARSLGLAHQPRAVWDDWSYNARLGSTYLRGLAETFGGNPVLVAAGYNAGPGRPKQWIEQLGDPRSRVVDVVDWIEHIPFRETQNYVMRVSESLPVYRARLGEDPLPVPFSTELKGSGLLPRSD
ncbi:lytic transglycosylase domain-containing protein [Pseudooceanicola sp.]|uniref:lytic transglycosylase domain-containing protein n=1 Tax=Pseudooceanicola sp. TaxID=1914328 RepID=UPI002618FCD0|nr:lytic transglycosylase domain-containing protein [Pseudooceanicola sp.]